MPLLASILLKPMESLSHHQTLVTAVIPTLQSILKRVQIISLPSDISNESDDGHENERMEPQNDFLSLVGVLLVRLVSNLNRSPSLPSLPLPFMNQGLTLSSLLQIQLDDPLKASILQSFHEETTLRQEQEEQAIMKELLEECSARAQALFTVLQKSSHLSSIIQRQRPLARSLTKVIFAFIVHHSSTSVLYVIDD